MRRVHIGTCVSPAEATLLRAAFDAHGIPVLINAEQHASMLGGLGGAFVPLHLYVDEADVDEASELLHDLRAQDPDTRLDDAELEAAALAAGEHPESQPTLEPEDPEQYELDVHAAHVNRRRRVGLLLFLGYGAAVTIPFILGRPMLAIALVGGVLCAMVVLMRAGRTPGPELPRARIKR